MGLADTALMLQAERDRERRESDRQTRLAQDRLKRVHALEDALREYIRGADWYRRCLEEVRDGRRVNGLKEAATEYVHALDRAQAALSPTETAMNRWRESGDERDRRAAGIGDDFSRNERTVNE